MENDTLASSACNTADCWGVVRVRVRFFLGGVVVEARGSGLLAFSTTISSCKSDELELWRLARPCVSGDSLRIRLAIGFSVELSDAVRRLELDSAICGSKDGGVTGRPRSSIRRSSDRISSRVWGREAVD